MGSPMSSSLKWLWKSLDLIMALLLVLMIAMVFANVVLRYGFDSGLRPAVELSRMGMVWLVMLGAVVLLRRDEHLALTELSQRAFPRFVPLLRRLAFVVIFVSALMLFWGSFRQMNANWNNISQLTGMPSGLFYLAGVISAVLMATIALVRIFKPDALREQEPLAGQEAGHS
jgi:TRAP-type C4-dicarboxylate transport system permease small subunit